MAEVTTISSIAYAHYTLYEALPRVARRGFKQVEIGSFGSYCYHFNAGSPSPPELRAMLADLDLKPVALNWSQLAGDAHDPASAAVWLDVYKRKIEDALEVGFPMMTMHFGGANDRPDQEEQRRFAADVYRRLAEHAGSRGMRMLLELPHMYLIHHDCETVFELLDELDPAVVGVLLDSSHWGVIGYDLDAYLDRLGSRLWHVHLRDATPRSTPELDRTFKRPAVIGKYPYNLTLTPGRGSVDFARLGAALDRIGYEGDVTTEFEYFDMRLDEIERQYDAGLRHLLQCGWSLPEGIRFLGDGSPSAEGR